MRGKDEDNRRQTTILHKRSYSQTFVHSDHDNVHDHEEYGISNPNGKARRRWGVKDGAAENVAELVRNLGRLCRTLEQPAQISRVELSRLLGEILPQQPKEDDVLRVLAGVGWLHAAVMTHIVAFWTPTLRLMTSQLSSPTSSLSLSS